MPVLAFNPVDVFLDDVFSKVHALKTDVLKIALSNVVITSATSILSQVTQISSGNGYETGGLVIPISNFSGNPGDGSFSLIASDDVALTATGPIPSFRYLYLYNDSSTNKKGIAFYDYGTPITLGAANDSVLIKDGSSLFTVR